MLGRRPLPSSERANMLVRLDFQKESNNLGLINIFPEVSKCLPIRTLRFSEQNSEILKYYLFSIKKNFFFILEGSWRAKLLFDRPVHGLRPREAPGSSQPGLEVMHPLSQQKQKAADSRGEPAVCRRGVHRHLASLCVAMFLRN